MMNSRNTPINWSRFLLMAACLALLIGTAAQADEDLSKSERELKQMKDLQRKMKSAGRESSNSTRQKLSETLRGHMVDCIIRREDDLGMEHTIKKHGETTTSGTTDAAKAGAPVGTSSSKQAKNLNLMDGPNADRLRQMSRMQSIFVSTQKIARPAIEKQGDSFDRYMEKLGKFEQQLQLWTNDLQVELESRETPKEEGEAAAEG